jgi:hypothetical protein
MRRRFRFLLASAALVLATVVVMFLVPPVRDRAPVGAPRAPVVPPSERTSRAPANGTPPTAGPPPKAPERATRGADRGSRQLPTRPSPHAAAPERSTRADSTRIESIGPVIPDHAAPKMPELTMPVAPPARLEAVPELESAAPPKVFEQESVALAKVLSRYEQAYNHLDAGAAAAIWPSVDVRALRRAFARLENQDLQLRDCTFAVSASDAAVRCAGVLQYAQRIGDRTPKTERHVWTIEFVRAGAQWQIARVTAQ